MTGTTAPLTGNSALAVLSTILAIRKKTYLDAVHLGDMTAAPELYLWNTYMAATILRTTGIVEVHVRNRIDEALRQWNLVRGGSGEWITEPEDVLASLVKPAAGKTLAERADITSVDGAATHDDLVAELPFGTWARLLPSPNVTMRNPRMRICREALEPVFGIPGRPPKATTAQMMRLVQMRNRAAHHRPLLDTKALHRCHQDVLDVLSQLDLRLRRWMKQEKWIVRGIEAMPSLPASEDVHAPPVENTT